MKSKLKCEVVQDLLPIYLDGIGSEVTNLEVKEHLEECPDCNASYEAMNTPEKISKEKNREDIKFMIKIKRKHLITTFVSVLCAAFIIVCAVQVWGYLRSKECAISAKYINISDVYLLTNGKLICKIDVSDDCPYTKNERTGHSTGNKDVFTGGISEEYGLWEKWFGNQENSVAQDNNIENYVLMDISNYVSVSDGEIKSTGSVTILYEGEDSGDTLLIWKTGEPLSIAPAELEDYVKGESLLGYYI